jgi:protein required for attachment to host cells
MLLDHGTWIVAADGARAVIVRNDGTPAKPKFTLIRRYEQENPPTREQGTDRPGRTNDAGTHKSAMEQVDWHQLAEDRFVHGLVGELTTAFNRHEFEALVIVAPPAALGEMRKALPDQIREHVISEINKDLTNLNIHELQEAITKQLSA